MSSSNVFLSFRNRDTRKNLSEMICTSIDNEEQSEPAILKQFMSSQREDLEFSTFIGPLDLLGLYWDKIMDSADQHIINHSRQMKWADFGAFIKEKLLVSSKYGSVYRGENGRGKIQSRKKALVKTTAMDAITMELVRILEVKKVNEIHRSLFSCYVDGSSNSQMKTGILCEGDATDAVSITLNISVYGKFTSLITNWENLQFLDLHHLASATRQPQPCTKMFSNAAMLPFIDLYNSGIMSMNTTYNRSYGLDENSMKYHAPRAHPPPENDMLLKNNHMTRKTSLNSLFVTIFLVTTFVAALGFSSSTFKDAYSTSKDLITSRLIIAINTLVFVVSLVMDMFLLHKSTYKWELQIALFALFGAYICLMKVMVPQAAFPLFLLSVPFLFFAAA